MVQTKLAQGRALLSGQCLAGAASVRAPQHPTAPQTGAGARHRDS